MAAPHAPDPAHGDPDAAVTTKSPGSVFAFLLELFKQSPPWVRVVVVLGVFAAVGFGIYKWMSGSKEETRISPQYVLDPTKQIDPPGSDNHNPANVAATQRISDDDAHFRWHSL